MWAPCNVRGLACRNLSVNYEIKGVEPLALISNIREEGGKILKVIIASRSPYKFAGLQVDFKELNKPIR